jgi:hypothetical protein
MLFSDRHQQARRASWSADRRNWSQRVSTGSRATCDGRAPVLSGLDEQPIRRGNDAALAGPPVVIVKDGVWDGSSAFALERRPVRGPAAAGDGIRAVLKALMVRHCKRTQADIKWGHVLVPWRDADDGG